MNTLDKLFEDVFSLEKQVKTRWPDQRGRVIIANLKTDMDYEFGKPTNDGEHIKWAIEYKSRLKSKLSE